MLKSFNGLTEQIFRKDFRNMLFSVYNFAEEEYYISKLGKLGYDNGIDNLEFITLDNNNSSNEDLVSFKNYIENVLQNGRIIIGVLFYRSKGRITPIIIKPKSVLVEDILKES